MESVVSKHKQHGIVLADLVLGLMVGAIVLAAAAAMADAMSHGKRATEQMTRSANYLIQLHTRLSDLTMRADHIEARDGGGVLLTYADGQTAEVYADPDTAGRIVIKEADETTSYLSDPAQTNVSIQAADVNSVVLTFDITENGTAQTYKMTATRRGGE